MKRLLAGVPRVKKVWEPLDYETFQPMVPGVLSASRDHIQYIQRDSVITASVHSRSFSHSLRGKAIYSVSRYARRGIGDGAF